MAAKRPIVLVHGYSDRGESFRAWRDALVASGRYDPADVRICNYKSLTNEVTIKDLAEGFDRTLRKCAGLEAEQPFDAIVHSTGMLVVRAWLTSYTARRDRLKHLIGLAPATNGSPLAHKGRSLLGSIFKGNKAWGPDFMEAGDRVLDGLELASKFTWDLAHRDLFDPDAGAFYGASAKTPYCFIFCGTDGYGGIRGLVNEPGTDGTVRHAGCALDSRKVVLDLAIDAEGSRAAVEKFANVDSPTYFVDGLNHGTIMTGPTGELVAYVLAALDVSTGAQFDAWTRAATAAFAGGADALGDRYQQFVVRAVDERGDPITDYHVEMTTERQGFFKGVREFDLDVHTYKADPSLRCFHVNLTALGKLKPGELATLRLRVIASSGTKMVVYQAVGRHQQDVGGKADDRGQWTGSLDLSKIVGGAGSDFKLFYPFTTTFIELRLNREPVPLDKYYHIFEMLEGQ